MMHVRFLNMESYLIIGLMLFIYSTLVQTSNRDDFIKELTAGIIDGVTQTNDVEDKRRQKDTTTTILSASTINDKGTTERQDGGDAVELKKEIIDAFVNLLYDKLQQKTKEEMLKKELANTITEENERKEAQPAALPTLKLQKSEEPGLWGRETVRGPPGLWGKRDADNENTKQFHEGHARVYGPPGLWGRGITDAGKRASNVGKRASNAGPPGLWGREVLKKEQEENNISENGPPGLWGREIETKRSSRSLQEKRMHKKNN